MPQSHENGGVKKSGTYLSIFGEAIGIVILAAMLGYFLKISWRKWPDPIVDFGQQCYAFWRLSQGAVFNHDFYWNYGPLSVYFNAGLFRVFGPGIMVLVWANLVVYLIILILSYIAFRAAWGKLGAFSATAVFISVFSFSHLLAVGNYNYATPYAAESTHGMVLLLAAVLVAVKWVQKASRILAFVFGLLGGFAVVIKPEFMLALGLLGMALIILRWSQRKPMIVSEYFSVFCGGIIPTLLFTLLFLKHEPLALAFPDASQAWWAALVHRLQSITVQQKSFSGFDQPWRNTLRELQCTGIAATVIGSIWAAGWVTNRPWRWLIRSVAISAFGAIAFSLRLQNGWLEDVGRCFPGLLFIVLIIATTRLRNEIRANGTASESSTMAFVLALVGLAMMARMLLFGHVYHLGFFQAALGGMVLAAVMTSWLPQWTGSNPWGRRLTLAGCATLLIFCCGTIATLSRSIRADQTQSVAMGCDQFFATTPQIDGAGAIDAWAIKQLSSTPENSTLLVFPEGVMINYLVRRRNFDPAWIPPEEEEQFLKRFTNAPPDYVLFITRDLTEFGLKRFGTEGSKGKDVVTWVTNHYSIQAGLGADPVGPVDQAGARLWRLKQP